MIRFRKFAFSDQIEYERPALSFWGRPTGKTEKVKGVCRTSEDFYRRVAAFASTVNVVSISGEASDGGWVVVWYTEPETPKPHVLFVVLGPNAEWVRVFDTEQKARRFVQGFRAVAFGAITVSRVVDGQEDTRVSAPADFDPTIPLFPLGASAS